MSTLCARSVLGALYKYQIYSSQLSYELGVVIIPVLYMRNSEAPKLFDPRITELGWDPLTCETRLLLAFFGKFCCVLILTKTRLTAI